MVAGLGNIWKVPELRKRISFTLLMLAVYRLGIFVATPGVNAETLKERFQDNASELFNMVNLFSGSALENFSIFTLGIMPYISMSIIVQFLTPVIPALESLKKEGPAGQKVLTRYIRYGTMVLALIQGTMIAKGLAASQVLNPGVGGFSFYFTTALTLTAGTAFIMWLGEQITERGIGNGISIIIFAGIIARMPQSLYDVITKVSDTTSEVTWLSVWVILAFCCLTVAAIVYVERSQRRIPLQYPRNERMLAKEVGNTPYLPFKVNTAGVIPPIFASALLVLPATLGTLFVNNDEGSSIINDIMSWIVPGTLGYTLVYVFLIFVFSYYYVSVIVNPKEIADNLKKNGAFIPSVRPGSQTADYLYGILNRLTFWGAIYIALVCIIPGIFYNYFGVGSFNYIFGGTAVLIAVGVTLDTASQIQSILTARHYEAFMAKSAKGKIAAGPFRGARTRILKR